MLKSNKHKHAANKCLSECKAICCNDLAVQIYKPVTKSEKEDLRWHLFFDAVKVFIRNRKWHLLIHSKCRYLSGEHRCTIYNKRPQRCIQHNHPHCELEGKFYDTLLKTPEEFDEYFAKSKKKTVKKKKK